MHGHGTGVQHPCRQPEQVAIHGLDLTAPNGQDAYAATLRRERFLRTLAWTDRSDVQDPARPAGLSGRA